jgi:hypothetical protein
MGDNLNVMKMEDDLYFFLNGRRPTFFENGRQDSLIFLKSGRRSQFVVNKIIMQPKTLKKKKWLCHRSG